MHMTCVSVGYRQDGALRNMKQKVLPIRVDDELYEWLKDYARRKHSNMAAVITRLLVDQKETDESDQTQRLSTARRKITKTPRKK